MRSRVIQVSARFLFTLLILLLSGCGQKERAAMYKVDVDLLKVQEVSLSDVFNKIEVIPLEAKDSAFLNVSCLSSYLVAENLLLVQDRANNAVVIFSLDGKWRGTLSKYGRGPEEYVMLTDMDYNTELHSIDILEATGKVLSYALTDGFPLIRKLDFSHRVNGLTYFKSIPSGYYLFSGYSRTPLHYLESNSCDVVDIEGVPKAEQNRRAGYKTTGSPFYVFDDSVFYIDGATGQVFRLEGQESTPYLAWNLGRFSFKPKKVDASETGTSIERMKVASNAMAGPFSTVSETSQSVFTNVLFMGRGVNILYDKTTNEVKIFARTREGVMFSPGYVYEDALYFLVPPEIASQVIPYDMIPPIREESNYILIKYIP